MDWFPVPSFAKKTNSASWVKMKWKRNSTDSTNKTARIAATLKLGAATKEYEIYKGMLLVKQYHSTK